MSQKGGEFERETCKELSAWWTKGKRTDVFWRSSQSGGRATVRGRKGLTTAGHYGDVCATDPIGAPLLDLTTIELKRGYNAEHIHALMDRKKGSPQPCGSFGFSKQQTRETWPAATPG